MPSSCTQLPALSREDVLQVSSTLEGVELGQFITKTQQGRVFRGVYNGEAVTVKVGPSFDLCMMCFHACRGQDPSMHHAWTTEAQHYAQQIQSDIDMHRRVHIVWQKQLQCWSMMGHCRKP